jgi:hypothetical protein
MKTLGENYRGDREGEQMIVDEELRDVVVLS